MAFSLSFTVLSYLSHHRSEVCSRVPEPLPPAGTTDLAVARGCRDSGSSDCCNHRSNHCFCKTKMEAQSEEEESIKLRGETAITAQQLRGRIIFISDHSVTQVLHNPVMVMKPNKNKNLIMFFKIQSCTDEPVKQLFKKRKIQFIQTRKNIFTPQCLAGIYYGINRKEVGSGDSTDKSLICQQHSCPCRQLQVLKITLHGFAGFV